MISTFIQNQVAESTLTIDSVDVIDAGTYVCTSTDKTNAKFRVELTNYKTRMSQDQPIDENGRGASTPLSNPQLLEQSK